MNRLFKILLILSCLYLLSVGAQEVNNADEIAELRRLIEEKQVNLNYVWTTLSAGLVLFMQLGFLLLEAGWVRSKNSINVALKNFSDFLVSVICFYIIGYGLMFGASSNGIMSFDSSKFLWNQTSDWDYTFFLFQAMFAGTAATIMSGCVAERMKFNIYLVIAVLIAIVIYPIFGHLAWGNLLVTTNEPYLASKGFIDFAGSTVVHSIGAWIGLAGAIIIGPRKGKYNEKGEAQKIQGHSMILATSGAVILWVGWIGFNGGSTTAGTPEFARIIANTMLSCVFAGVSAIILGRAMDKIFLPSRAVNGSLAGLVAITAGCSVVTPHSAILIGSIAGILVVLSEHFIEHTLKIDDPLGAVSVHGVNGSFGTIIIGFLAEDSHLLAATRFDQILVQFEGVFIAFIWSFGLSYGFMWVLNKFYPLRITEYEEQIGLNIAEHGESLGIGSMMEKLNNIVSGERDLTIRLEENSGDENADIALVLNPFLDTLHEMMSYIRKQSSELNNTANHLSDLSNKLSTSSELAYNNNENTLSNAKDAGFHINNIASLSSAINDQIKTASSNANMMKDNISSTSDSISKLVSSIKEIVDNTQKANKLSENADSLSKKITDATNILTSSTNEISNVVETINKIANTTNMLAMNATIEAARASDTSKGFKVVADEVKNLARKSQESTVNIKEKIDTVTENVSNIVEVIEQIKNIISLIGDSIKDVNKISEQQNDFAHNIAENMEGVNKISSEVVGSIHIIKEETNDISTKTGNINKEMNNITGDIENIKKDSSDNKISAEEIKNNAVKLQKLSADLKEFSKKFKLD